MKGARSGDTRLRASSNDARRWSPAREVFHLVVQRRNIPPARQSIKAWAPLHRSKGQAPAWWSTRRPRQ